MLGARKKRERETRKLRCAKPSAPKSSRRRMKPILHWTKSKAEAYTPRTAPTPSWLHSVFAFLAGISETACCGRRSGSQPPFDARFSHERSLLPAAFSNRIYGVSIKATMSASLIGRLGSSTFRLSAAAVSMSLTGSCFSSESAPRPFHHGIRGRGGAIFGVATAARFPIQSA